nr:hypothetical protein [Tanacetum cinerariifolium]
ARGCWEVVVEVVGVEGSCLNGEKLREKGVQIGGKYCALHSVSNVKDREGVLLGDFTFLVPGVSRD